MARLRWLWFCAPVLLAADCRQDTCFALCTTMARTLDACLDQWPVGWEEEGERSRVAFRTECENEWSDLRADLAPRELSDALDQCEEAATALERMSADDTTCDELRALYLDP
ncbi:MAG: hypothetical protein JNM72_17300 [Deltaproteobacteria bacterium]|jgi:hypothetical protein|nr:hypothetical protein [Deltaproteobacteria bacterium]